MSTHELFGSDSESSDNDGGTQELPSTQAHMEDLFGNASDSNEEIEMDSDMKKKGYQSYPIQDQGSDSSSNEDDEESKTTTAINKPAADEPMNVDQELDFSGTEETDTKPTNDERKLSDEEGTNQDRINNEKKLNEKEILNQSMPTTQDLFGEDLDDDDDSDDSSIKGVKLQTAPTTQDLFGDEDLDMSSDEETLNEPSNERNKESTNRMIQDSDEEQPPSPEEEKEEEGLSISIELPRCNMSLGKELYFVKLPNFLSVDTKPFDPTLYEDEIDDDEILDEEGRTRLKLKVENTLRWRYSKDREGNEVKESNCRFVRWSDGSLTMHLGNEVFDVFKMPIEGEQNHLFVQQGTGLQAQAVFKTKLTFRPQSTASQTHRKMTMSIADRMSKAQKIKFMPATDHDPESQRSTIMKKEDERMRAQSRRESQQRRMREKNHLKGMTTSYLEGDLDADEEDFDNSIAAIKNRYKKDVKGGGRNPYHEVYSDESDGDNKLEKAKLDFDSDDDDLSDPDIRRKKEELSKKKKGGRKVIEESDEEESD